MKSTRVLKSSTLILAATVLMMGTASCSSSEVESKHAASSSSRISGEPEGVGKIDEAIRAVFDAPLDAERAKSFICREKRREKQNGSDVEWAMVVDSIEVEELSNRTATVRVVLSAENGEKVTTTVILIENQGKWQVCG